MANLHPTALGVRILQRGLEFMCEICLKAQGEHVTLKQMHRVIIEYTAYTGRGCVF